jgi:Ca2+-binding RTX toxin-like protein
VIVGLGGNDIIHGFGGSDRVCGSAGADSIFADAGTVHAKGGLGDDLLYGGPGADVLTGGAGADQAFGAAGSDTIAASAGDDSIDGGAGNDHLIGGLGFDAVLFIDAPSFVHASLASASATGDGADTLTGFEGVFGSAFNDVLTGDPGETNFLVGSAGNDRLLGGDGAATNCTASGSCFDYLAGGDGDDVVNGGPGQDFAAFIDSIAPVTVNLGSGSATGQGSDSLRGIEGIDGTLGGDSMTGDQGDNYFVGEGGNDSEDGAGDVYGDAAFYLFASNSVSVSLKAGSSSGADGSDSLTRIESLVGSDSGDTLVGDAGPNVLLGLDGDDALDGLAGLDSLDGGVGTDTCLHGEINVDCENTALAASAMTANRLVAANSVTSHLLDAQAVGGRVESGVSGPPAPERGVQASGHPYLGFGPDNHTDIGPPAAATTSALFYQHPSAQVARYSRAYAIFWVPSGWSIPSNFEYMMYQYFSDVGGSGLYNTMTQYFQTAYGYRYYILNNAAWAGFYEDTTGYPAGRCNNPVTGDRCILDSDIQAAVIRAAKAKGWSGGINNHYFVYTAYGEGSCFTATCQSAAYADYCAYHYAFPYNSQWFIYANMPFANSGDPDPSKDCRNKVPTAPNGDRAIDAEISVTSHEQFEMVTDPYGGICYPAGQNCNAWSAWQGTGGLQDENGDKCSKITPTLNLDGGLANQYWNGHYYIIQTEFSNEAYYANIGYGGVAGCVLTR